MKGLRARGGFEVDIEWDASALTRMTVKALVSNRCTIRYARNTVEYMLDQDAVLQLDANLKPMPGAEKGSFS